MFTRIVSIFFVVSLLTMPVWAKTSYLPNARTEYPSIIGTRLDSCTLCHSSGSSRNSYGSAYGGAGRNFDAIKNLDSDGDGISNLTEIADLAFPGNASDFPKGAVQVTISPPAAVTAGAQWRIAPSGTYQNSGATLSGLKIGDAVVQFKSVSGWTTPADIPLTIVFNQTTSQSGLYAQQQVSVPNVVGSTQAAASTALTGTGLTLGTVTQASSNTVPAGQIISQNPTANTQVAPGSSVNVVISTGPSAVPVLSVLPLIRNVGAAAGTTTFSISNLGGAGVVWTASVITGVDWLTLTSGQQGTDVGTVTMSFTANTSTTARTGTVRVVAPGATGSPSDVNVTQAGQQTGGIGTLQVTIEPQAARDAGAQWSVDGGEWHDSGTQVLLPVGQHTVSFKDVQYTAAKTFSLENMPVGSNSMGCMGSLAKVLLPNPDDGLKAAATGGCAGSQTPQWVPPADVDVAVTEGQTAAITGTYTQAKKTLSANVAGSSAGDMLVLFLSAASLLVIRRRKARACACRIDRR